MGLVGVVTGGDQWMVDLLDYLIMKCPTFPFLYFLAVSSLLSVQFCNLFLFLHVLHSILYLFKNELVCTVCEGFEEALSTMWGKLVDTCLVSSILLVSHAFFLRINDHQVSCYVLPCLNSHVQEKPGCIE